MNNGFCTKKKRINMDWYILEKSFVIFGICFWQIDDKNIKKC